MPVVALTGQLSKALLSARPTGSAVDDVKVGISRSSSRIKKEILGHARVDGLEWFDTS